jgi:hypothetical protein
MFIGSQRLGFDRDLRLLRERPGGFWDAMVKETGIEWFDPYDKVLTSRGGMVPWVSERKLNIA